MDFNKSIKLNTYSDKANKQFDEMQSRLSQIENSFQTRMNGKTTGRLIGTFIGTFLWIAAFAVGAVYAKDMVNEYLYMGALVAVFGLLLFMLIDNIMNFSYYGKISKYKGSVSQLKNRVSIGKNSVKANHDAFMDSKANGWNYPLNAASSISEEATSVESTVTNMEALKRGFIHRVKNVLFYAAAILFTVVCCTALFKVGSDIILGIIDEEISADTLKIFNIIALVIAGILEIIFAKMVWGKTNCSVTNVTLFIVALGPVAFLALIAIVTLIVALVLAVIQVVIAIAGVVIAGAIAFSCLCGG